MEGAAHDPFGAEPHSGTAGTGEQPAGPAPVLSQAPLPPAPLHALDSAAAATAASAAGVPGGVLEAGPAVGTQAELGQSQTGALASGMEETDDDDDAADAKYPFHDDPSVAEGGDGAERRPGRRKITIEYIEDKSKRHITFSKRKSGIMKKAFELSTLTGTQVLLVVASETGHVYTFATRKLKPLITRPEGKNLIQACLNAPDTPPQSPDRDMVGASSVINAAAAAAAVAAAGGPVQPPVGAAAPALPGASAAPSSGRAGMVPSSTPGIAPSAAGAASSTAGMLPNEAEAKDAADAYSAMSLPPYLRLGGLGAGGYGPSSLYPSYMAGYPWPPPSKPPSGEQ